MAEATYTLSKKAVTAEKAAFAKSACDCLKDTSSSGKEGFNAVESIHEVVELCVYRRWFSLDCIARGGCSSGTNSICGKQGLLHVSFCMSFAALIFFPAVSHAVYRVYLSLQRSGVLGVEGCGCIF